MTKLTIIKAVLQKRKFEDPCFRVNKFALGQKVSGIHSLGRECERNRLCKTLINHKSLPALSEDKFIIGKKRKNCNQVM